MNNILYQEFSQKLRTITEEIIMELAKQPVNPVETIQKIKILWI